MPTNYGLRTPLYAQAVTGNSLIKSAKLLLYNDGTLIYTIVKDVVTSVPVVFEIAELLRDYLQVTISETFATPVPLPYLNCESAAAVCGYVEVLPFTPLST